jgi:hypothetical protein
MDFTVPYDKDLLKFIALNNIDKSKVLKLGLKCFNTVNIQTQLWNNEEWELKINTLKSENKTLQEKYRIDLLEKDKKTERIIQNNKEQNNLFYETIKSQNEIKYKDIISELKGKINKLQDKNDGVYREISNEFQEKYKKQQLHHENRIDILRKSYEDKLLKEREIRESTIVRKSNSTIKGQDGENFMYFELNSRFPSAEIIDTHKETGRGDFILKDGITVLIETKNYKKNVTKPEITKFYRDIDTNHDIDCGLFLSLESGVCAKADFCLEVRDKKPIIFLHNITKNMKHIDIAISYFRMILSAGIDLSSKEIVDKIKNDIPMIKKNWNKMKQKIKKFEADMMDCVVQQENYVKNIFHNVKIKY